MSPFVKYAIILGLLVVIGPSAIDMYLPALPTIAREYEVDEGVVQMTLMAFFLALSLTQIVYGPASDAYGRKAPIYVGLGIFVAATVGCLFAPTIGWLIFFRFVQGLGASASMVICRAIIRDLHTGHEATRLMAMVMLVMSVSPMMAPLVGSALIVPFGWRSVFIAILLVALVSFLLVRFALPETHPVEKREPIAVGTLKKNFGKLLRDPSFLGLTMIGGCGMASFFAFLSSASFIYIDHFGLTPTQFAVAFAFNALGFFSMSQIAANMGLRFGMHRVVRVATRGFASGCTLLFILTIGGLDNFYVLAGLLFVSFAFLGLVIPTSMVLALEENGPIAGAASSLGGLLQMMGSVVSMAIMSVIFDGTVLPMVSVIFAFAMGALLLAQLTVKVPTVETPTTADPV